MSVRKSFRHGVSQNLHSVCFTWAHLFWNSCQWHCAGEWLRCAVHYNETCQRRVWQKEHCCVWGLFRIAADLGACTGQPRAECGFTGVSTCHHQLILKTQSCIYSLYSHSVIISSILAVERKKIQCILFSPYPNATVLYLWLKLKKIFPIWKVCHVCRDGK